MRLHRVGLTVLMAAGALAAPARAADPTAGTSPIKGSDAMSGKGRSGPDGWSWAPQTRDQAPADKGSQTGAAETKDLNSRPGPDAGKNLKPGDDPGTPVATDSHGPGTLDRNSAHRP